VDEGDSRTRTDLEGGSERRAMRVAARSDRTPSTVSRRLGGRTHREDREAPHPPQARPDDLRDAALATLEKLERGVLLLDTDGVVQFMNHAARAMLSRGHGLSLRKVDSRSPERTRRKRSTRVLNG
jgi:hypothetical protein